MITLKTPEELERLHNEANAAHPEFAQVLFGLIEKKYDVSSRRSYVKASEVQEKLKELRFFGYPTSPKDYWIDQKVIDTLFLSNWKVFNRNFLVDGGWIFGPADEENPT